jgi:outer membrane receptor for ferrienterochelin and colicins
MNKMFPVSLPINQFKRIEVVKGPESAVYGADAFGGVINLVSFDNADMPSTVSVRGGRFGTAAMSVQQALTIDEHRFSFAFDYMQYDDDPGRIVVSDLQATLDSIFGSIASNAPGRIDEHYDVLSLNARWQWQQWSLNYWTWRNFDVGTAGGGSIA